MHPVGIPVGCRLRLQQTLHTPCCCGETAGSEMVNRMGSACRDCLLQVKAQGGLQTTIFNAALRYKQLWMRLGYKTTDASPLCNRVFFSKTQVRTNCMDMCCCMLQSMHIHAHCAFGKWFFMPRSEPLNHLEPIRWRGGQLDVQASTECGFVGMGAVVVWLCRLLWVGGCVWSSVVVRLFPHMQGISLQQQ